MTALECTQCGEPVAPDTELVMTLGVRVMQATAGLDPYTPSTIRPLADIEVLWAEAMRQWMANRNIPLDGDDYLSFLANASLIGTDPGGGQ